MGVFVINRARGRWLFDDVPSGVTSLNIAGRLMFMITYLTDIQRP
jgi:hypothetical protein